MKKRKREKLNVRKGEQKREWIKVRQLQEIERIYNLLDCHFDLEKYIIRSEDNSIGIDLKTTINDLSCEKCCHFTFECKGKGLRGESVMECMNEEKHKDCEIGVGWQEDSDYMDDEDFFSEITLD